MAKLAIITLLALVAACMCTSVLAGGKCMFVDGDCKPNPGALPGGAKGAAVNWLNLLKGFKSCVGKTGGTCSGKCTIVAGKGCTLTTAARKAYLGGLAASFGACPKITSSTACSRNGNCKVGAGGKCVISATGIQNVFGLASNFPAAINTLVACKKLVASAGACNAA